VLPPSSGRAHACDGCYVRCLCIIIVVKRTYFGRNCVNRGHKPLRGKTCFAQFSKEWFQLKKFPCATQNGSIPFVKPGMVVTCRLLSGQYVLLSMFGYFAGSMCHQNSRVPLDLRIQKKPRNAQFLRKKTSRFVPIIAQRVLDVSGCVALPSLSVILSTSERGSASISFFL